MGLGAYIVRRILLLIPIIIGVTALVFAITMLFNVYQRATLYIRDPKQLTPQNIQGIIDKYGLNDPFYKQYFRWMGQVLQGNLGWSVTASRPVLDCILDKFPVTFEIVLYSAPIIIFLGIYLGVKSAVHRDTIIDHITRSVSIIGTSLPSFWLAILLISFFYVQLGWFMPLRLSSEVQHFVESPNFIRYTRLNTIDGILNGQLWVTADAFRHLIMPIIVLVIIQIALIIRVTRSSMLEALNKPYIILAKAKGLSDKEVINKHARRNALIPTVTLSGLLVAGMLTGLVITETVFNMPGLGSWAARSAQTLDIAAVLGFTMFSAVVFVLSNLIVDILYAYLDPRIRLA
jgi:peptide/nickel transport system permease protein